MTDDQFKPRDFRLPPRPSPKAQIGKQLGDVFHPRDIGDLPDDIAALLRQLEDVESRSN